MKTQVVWFKRDLRLSDHAALAEAAKLGPVLPLIIVESEYWQLPDTSARQWEFWRGCILELGREIAAQGGRLVIRTGPATDILEDLHSRIGSFDLWSHEETGNAWTYRRDLAVKAWARGHDISWRERRQFGVTRGRAQNRDHWAKRWDQMMRQPITATPVIEWAKTAPSDALPTANELNLAPDVLLHPQRPGRTAGFALLKTFLHERGMAYSREMSSPVTAESACSRLSPYLAYGALSMREVYQAAEERASQISRERPAGHTATLFGLAPSVPLRRDSIGTVTSCKNWRVNLKSNGSRLRKSISGCDRDPEIQSISRPGVRAVLAILLLMRP